MTRFERAFRRRLGPSVVTGYREAPADRAEAIALLLAHVRAAGCDCQPEITLPEVARPGEVSGAVIAHDDGCALLRRLGGGSVSARAPPDRRTPSQARRPRGNKTMQDQRTATIEPHRRKINRRWHGRERRSARTVGAAAPSAPPAVALPAKPCRCLDPLVLADDWCLKCGREAARQR